MLRKSTAARFGILFCVFTPACRTELLVDPPYRVPVVLPEMLRPVELPLAVENIFQCSVVTYDENGGRPGYRLTTMSLDRGRHPREQAIGEAQGQGHSLGRFRYVRWDPSSKRKLIEAMCVLPLTKKASELAARVFESVGLVPARDASESKMPSAWGDAVIHCYYYPEDDHLECEGEFCTEWEALKASLIGSPDWTQANSTYTCGNGCEIYDFEYYWCPGGSGWEGDSETNYGQGPGGGPCGNATVEAMVDEYTHPTYGSDYFYPICDDFASGGRTLNFSWSELNGGFSGGNPHSPWGLVGGALKQALEDTRTNYNRGGIRLTSGYRCPHGNHAVGGVLNSYHISGRAADMYSNDHPWTEAEFNLLKAAAEETITTPIESLDWSTYTDHHYHVAW